MPDPEEPQESQGFPVEMGGQEIPVLRDRGVLTDETVRPVLLGAMAGMGVTAQMGPQERMVQTDETESTAKTEL